MVRAVSLALVCAGAAATKTQTVVVKGVSYAPGMDGQCTTAAGDAAWVQAGVCHAVVKASMNVGFVSSMKTASACPAAGSPMSADQFKDETCQAADDTPKVDVTQDQCATVAKMDFKISECATMWCSGDNKMDLACSVEAPCDSLFVDHGASAGGKEACTTADAKVQTAVNCAGGTCVKGTDEAACCKVAGAAGTTTKATNATNDTATDTSNTVSASIAGAALVSAASLVFA